MESKLEIKSEHEAINDNELLDKILTNHSLRGKLTKNFGYGTSKTDQYCYYYIGAFWIDKNTSLIIKPKIKDLDFMMMFIQCLRYPQIVDKFHQIYDINLTEDPIPYKDNKSLPELDHLLVIHFLRLLEVQLHSGLKKNFIYREENLSSKIKGKILFNQHIKKNLIKNRLDKVYCQFLEYDINCLENRVLKKALTICIKSLTKIKKGIHFSYCYSYFTEVSDVVNPYELHNIKINPLYRKYKTLIDLAVQIIKLKRYQDLNEKKGFPPFWINMPLLFEKYVYSLLLDNTSDTVEYQHGSTSGYTDFLLKEQKLIVDTKYKLDRNSLWDMRDIRQVSAYARDLGVYKFFDIDRDTENKEILPCLLIYPNKQANNSINLKEKTPIEGFEQIYKLGVQLPLLKTN